MDLLVMNKENYKNEWYKTVKNSVVLHTGNLPPEILGSWRRSLTIDPLSSNNIIPINDYNKIRDENKDFISIAKPIMNDICEIAGKSFVLLCDNKGRTIENVSNIDYPVPVRGIYNESYVGTNAIGTTLVEKNPLEIRYKEHYNIRFHQYSCAGVPIMINDDVMGVICVVSPYDDLPKGFSRTVKLGVRVIEKQLQMNHEVNNNQDVSLYKLFDTIQDCLMIIDSRGNLLFVNNAFINILEENGKSNLIGGSLKELIDDKKTTNDILSDRTNVNKLRLVINWKDKRIVGTIMKKWVYKHLDNRIFIFFQVQDSSSKSIDFSEQLYTFDDVIGNSIEWLKIKERCIKASFVSTNVLIEGESGTGKELIAQAIHSSSGRTGLFIPINCGAISKGLLESELFGYEEGAFTGAIKKGKRGKIEAADGGTLFLDEIGEMPLDMQVSLLRFLENGLITRVGGTEQKKVDVRIIAATNRNLSNELIKGNFREDLFYRLNVIKIDLPPLRERKEDIPLLAKKFADTLCSRFNRAKVSFADKTLTVLSQYHWQGNVRELRNTIESTIVFLEGDAILPKDLPNHFSDIPVLEHEKKINQFDNAEKNVIIKTLEECNGNITWTAKRLGIARNTLYRKMKKLNIAYD